MSAALNKQIRNYVKSSAVRRFLGSLWDSYGADPEVDNDATRRALATYEGLGAIAAHFGVTRERVQKAFRRPIYQVLADLI